MTIPSIYVLKDINKVLLFADELSKNSVFPEKNTILKAASSIGYGDKKGHSDSLEFIVELGLINVSRKHYQISPLGRDFLKLNPNKYVETNIEQKRAILRLFLRNKRVRIMTMKILRHYGYPEIKDIIIDPLSYKVSPSEFILMNALRWLDFFKIKEGVWTPISKDVDLVFKKRDSISLKELEEVLSDEFKYSVMAEKLSVIFEKRRLRGEKMFIQSSLVNLIAEKDVNAGYDLLSFTGKESFEYDRFIEVKCSKGNKIRFFWSRNEYLTAKKLKNKYWIYYFPKIMVNKTPLIFRNPSATFKPPKYKILSTEFIIEEN